MVDGVSDDDVVSDGERDVGGEQTQTLWLTEAGSGARAIEQAAMAVADRLAHGLEVGFEDDEAVMAGVGDEQRRVVR